MVLTGTKFQSFVKRVRDITIGIMMIKISLLQRNFLFSSKFEKFALKNLEAQRSFDLLHDEMRLTKIIPLGSKIGRFSLFKVCFLFAKQMATMTDR